MQVVAEGRHEPLTLRQLVLQLRGPGVDATAKLFVPVDGALVDARFSEMLVVNVSRTVQLLDDDGGV